VSAPIADVEPTADELRGARVTAYLLGELSQDERASLEAELASDATLAAELEALREVTVLLTRELGRDAPGLDAAQRSALERAVAGKGGSGPAAREGASAPAATVVPLARARSYRRWIAPVALAAAFAIAVPTVLFTGSSKRESRSASVSAPETESARRGDRLEGKAVAAATAAPMSPMAQQRLDEKSKRPAGDRALPGGLDVPPKSGNDHSTFDDNPFITTSVDARSTFSIDVDTASYSLVRSYLVRGERPPKGAVRIEELINYFSYDYPAPTGEHPFSVSLDATPAPWAPSHQLVRIGLLGKQVTLSQQEGVNLVFLVDTSGSMSDANKLPLLRESLKLLLPKLGARDRVSIVAYAGSAGLVLPATPGDQQATILAALDRLSSGGSTNGGQGIELAYKVAAEQTIKGGVNRVILCTDGDFNVGTTSRDALVSLVRDKAKTGVFLSVLGFGMGNFKDSTLEEIADKGNGNYAYVDTLDEGRKVLVEGLGTLVTIAKDVKLQVELDPARVQSFRLIGYENRVLSHRDFDDDKKDAGELGSGHTVTALYELVPSPTAAGAQGNLLTVKLRYKEPDGDVSKELSASLGAERVTAKPSDDLRFAAGVAAFGMMLRGSRHRGATDWTLVRGLLEGGAASDATGRRRELLDLVKKAEPLTKACPPGDPLCAP
jgi:secreted protein with Ig-like and vWFA domain/anti-sigma factor RsiW